MRPTALFERERKGERAVLVLPCERGGADCDFRTQEFAQLALSAGAQVLGQVTARVVEPSARYYIGTGKVEEVGQCVRAVGADLVLVDHQLSPVQERNLERQLDVRVIDRSGLILDIFSQRARSHEGKLEVELAQLRHLSTRLVRGWSHLERQRGGSIGLRGPGETQLETDRRLLGIRVRQLTKRLAKVQTQRRQQRRARLRNPVPRVALVGYTNAGKSTLFNALTEARVYAADQLFATLDPTVRRLDGLDCGPVVLADTVGFVRELPHDLIAAFRATLAEARDADLLLHVSDAADPQRDMMGDVVDRVLHEIGASDVPQLRVMNKIDAAGLEPHVDGSAEHPAQRVWVSAASGAGLDTLRWALGKNLSSDRVNAHLDIPLAAGRLYAQLKEAGAVAGERVDDTGWHLHIDARRELLASMPGTEAAPVRALATETKADDEAID